MVIFQILFFNDKRIISKERNTVRASNPRASLTWTDNMSKVGYDNSCSSSSCNIMIQIYNIKLQSLPYLRTGRGSSIGSEFAWHASGLEFDPHVRHILSWRLGHENISMAILPLPLIQEEQLSVTGERMCTKYW